MFIPLSLVKKTRVFSRSPSRSSQSSTRPTFRSIAVTAAKYPLSTDRRLSSSQPPGAELICHGCIGSDGMEAKAQLAW